MRDILDPQDVWLGAPIGAQVFRNKAPVTVDDTLTVLQDSGPATVFVLANDYDPEGGSLTLMSAFAGLGSAVVEANNTVTYTPPPGFWGADTVVYEVADDKDQRQTGQINITVTEPDLTIGVSAANTLVVNAGTGTIDISVTEPPGFAGTYQANTSALTGGPVNLVPPQISGTATVGQALLADAGLWIYETGAGVPAQSWQWRRSGVDIPGESAASYTMQTVDIGHSLTVVETMTNGLGQRSTESAAPSAGFAPSDDAGLLAWFAADDVATLTTSANAVSAWADKASAGSLVQTNVSRQPASGTRLLNGLNVLDFSGGAFVSGNVTLPASGDVSVHMVLAIDATTNLFEAVLALNATNDFQIDANNSTQFDGRLNTSGVGPAVALSGGPFSGALILSVVMDRTGTATAEVFVSNVSRAATSYLTSLDSAQELLLMTNRSKNAWVDGAVGEVIVTASTANRAGIHGYLANKWGLV